MDAPLDNADFEYFDNQLTASGNLMRMMQKPAMEKFVALSF